MSLNAQKLGFHSQTELSLVLVANFLCALYCLWLLYVVWHNLWTETRERVDSDLVKEIQLSTRKGTTDTSVSIATSDQDRKRPVVDNRIKWIVTLYILGGFFNCVGTVVEPLIYGLVDSPGQACPHALHIVYLRTFTEGMFYSFYLIRAVVILQGSAFAVSKCLQYFLVIAPVVTFGCIFFVHNLREQFNNCNETGINAFLIILSLIIAQIFWNITLFAFLVANLASMVDDQCQKDLKEYLKKLLRLFLVSQCSALVLYVVLSVPSWSEALWTVVDIDLCVNCSTMLLSFAFAKPFFNRLCLCS
ncbi:hypothetical protein RFI_15083 [Reticulomyxa filosa]|uniref:Transmembrane protein n=1 Tax=Reticulomyxa filosa TaxID=46433 RepID=X6N7U1_RETFI|nr:hypothetical protein RFI_15083 [Reticulomyxa filosa]|eukprot:ETO22121.1 hypothetical protein RFI_15083 [Reticulomyxa filosa]